MESGRRRVLVVDADATCRSVSARVVERMGFEVVTVADGDGAARALADRDYSAMLVDLELGADAAVDQALAADIVVIGVGGERAPTPGGLSGVVRRPVSPAQLEGYLS